MPKQDLCHVTTAPLSMPKWIQWGSGGHKTSQGWILRYVIQTYVRLKYIHTWTTQNGLGGLCMFVAMIIKEVEEKVMTEKEVEGT